MLDMPVARHDGATPRRLCIIGAGVSGLVTAKVMREYGYTVTVIEKSRDIGGVWEPARSYPGVKTQTPRDLYSFTDFPMPSDYPEWPSGTQVHAYLNDYAARSGLRKFIRFGTEVLTVSRTDPTSAWSVTLRHEDGSGTIETFDFIVVATGQFSQPRRLELEGQDRFSEAGGLLRHSSEHVDAAAVKAKDVVVVGFSKSATDVAMNALAEGARSVTMIYREATWKIPYFFGGLVNFKNILYCRASEAMFMPWAPSSFGRIMRALSAPMIWANWRALESLLNLQFGLKKLGLRPAGRIEDSIHCATSIETPGFYKAIADGRIRAIKGEISAYDAGSVIVTGAGAIPADIVILAIGWVQDMPFLDEESRKQLIDENGQYRLHRLMINPDLPGLGFVGFNSSFITTLSAELGAHWLARYLMGALKRQPNAAAMRASLEEQRRWKRQTRPVATAFGGLCVAPFHHAHFDELMDDMGAARKAGNPLAAHLAPINPKTYAKLLATAPKPTEVKELIR